MLFNKNFRVIFRWLTGSAFPRVKDTKDSVVTGCCEHISVRFWLKRNVVDMMWMPEWIQWLAPYKSKRKWIKMLKRKIKLEWDYYVLMLWIKHCLSKPPLKRRSLSGVMATVLCFHIFHSVKNGVATLTSCLRDGSTLQAPETVEFVYI